MVAAAGVVVTRNDRTVRGEKEPGLTPGLRLLRLRGGVVVGRGRGGSYDAKPSGGARWEKEPGLTPGLRDFYCGGLGRLAPAGSRGRAPAAGGWLPGGAIVGFYLFLFQGGAAGFGGAFFGDDFGGTFGGAGLREGGAGGGGGGLGGG